MLRQLCDIGIEINIDDFGTGYSNLHYLMQFPISTLKIDRSFINPIRRKRSKHRNRADGHDAGAQPRNEGNCRRRGNRSSINELKNLNCEGAQGYFFGKAMNFEEAENYFREKNLQPMLMPPMEEISVVSTLQ